MFDVGADQRTELDNSTCQDLPIDLGSGTLYKWHSISDHRTAEFGVRGCTHGIHTLACNEIEKASNKQVKTVA